jgi:hypothetical protein
MKKTLWNVLAGNLALFALAAMVSCSCLCGGKDPAIGSAPFRRPGQDPAGKGEAWRFVVSGDSRNCGDVVMPGIAAGAKTDSAQFYWHLGDLRAIYDFDDDMVQEAKIVDKHLTISDYEKNAWDDFYKHQVVPFENTPFYLGIGNHEAYSPKTRCEFAKRFSALLDKPELQGGKSSSQAQSSPNGAKPTGSKGGTGDAAEKNSDTLKACVKSCEDCEPFESKTYYHWVKSGVDFIYLDNATNDQFDEKQWKWFDSVIKEDGDRKEIQTIVVGMRKALPWSVSCDHSMNESPKGIESGVKVYQALLDLQKKDKKLYVLASHSHFYMKDIFNTKHWSTGKNAGVLPGWIVGTAGAQRYPLPRGADLAKSRTNVYGYLLGRVFSNGTIDFEFTQLKASDVPQDVRNHYTEQFVSETCFADNRRTEPPEEKDYCKENP